MAAIKSTPHRQPHRHLTVADICEELGISRFTCYEWHAKRTAPSSAPSVLDLRTHLAQTAAGIRFSR
jgi:hypothetical protein